MKTFEALNKLYENRKGFIVIGLTGRTGSGCSTVAQLLSQEISVLNLPAPDDYGSSEKRKYEIIYRYIKENWEPFHWIQLKDIITSFIVENDFTSFSQYIYEQLQIEKEEIKIDFEQSIKEEYDSLHKYRKDIHILRKQIEESGSKDQNEIDSRRKQSFEFYFKKLPLFSFKLKTLLNKLSEESYTRLYQLIGDNIRCSGNALDSTFNPDLIFRLSRRVNKIIKLLRKINQDKPTYVVIDALRNPYEAIYFRERYSAFYLLAISTKNDDRIKRLQKDFNYNEIQIKQLDKKEYPEKLKGEQQFFSQNLPKCIEIADIHINNNQIGEDDLSDVKKQLAKYVTLIMHPGIVPPSHNERCMQIAHNAKLNSGCLSRQVGAAVTDSHYALKSIGWNATPEGQIPCILRNAEKLLNNEDKQAFSYYENNNIEFRTLLKDTYKTIVTSSNIRGKLKGINVSYCFKDIKNRLDKEKNQVHTRSLHAEENAFLQIAKYGGQGIQGGILFTTGL